MKKSLKQFMASATGLTRNPFFWTRVRITFVYVITSMIIVMFFSVTIYEVTAHNIRLGKINRPRFNETQFKNIEKQADFIRIQQSPEMKEFEKNIRTEILKNIKRNLMIIDSIILLLIVVLGYILSGYTIKPIKREYQKQKRFIEDASHDLRTPLSVIHSDLELAIGSNIDEKNDFIKSALAESSHMTKIVNDLTLLAKNASNSNLQKDETISNVLNSLVNIYKDLAQKKNLDFNSEITNSNIIVSGYLISRAIHNILDNALEYTNAGSISINTKNTNNGYNISIKDTGTGIASNDLKNIFNRFYRGDKSRNSRNHSGLGLSIAKSIIENHGGKIEINSTLGQGTEVRIIL